MEINYKLFFNEDQLNEIEGHIKSIRKEFFILNEVDPVERFLANRAVFNYAENVVNLTLSVKGDLSIENTINHILFDNDNRTSLRSEIAHSLELYYAIRELDLKRSEQ